MNNTSIKNTIIQLLIQYYHHSGLRNSLSAKVKTKTTAIIIKLNQGFNMRQTQYVTMMWNIR